ncbi:MAG TPA: hypothetical protein ACFYD2_11140 [Candidatus Avalokitesvara rifleensis]|uniref:hypothetical protein n=1 Tax=Candidatus Avalokitesvara rifleensis TaxID=3367620 RepID=UPI0040284DAD
MAVLVEFCITDVVVTLVGKWEGITSYLDNFPMAYIIGVKSGGATIERLNY